MSFASLVSPSTSFVAADATSTYRTSRWWLDSARRPSGKRRTGTRLPLDAGRGDLRHGVRRPPDPTRGRGPDPRDARLDGDPRDVLPSGPLDTSESRRGPADRECR